MIMLAIAYCRRKELAPHGILKFLLKAGACVLIMTGVVFALDHFVPAQGGKLMQLLIISVKGVIAILVYFAMAVIFKMEEATEWINKFKKKLFKKSAAKRA